MNSRGWCYWDGLRFSIKINEVNGKELYKVEISNRFAAFDNLDDDMDINSAWETIRNSVRGNAFSYELKWHMAK
jgi:hypothetical protein